MSVPRGSRSIYSACKASVEPGKHRQDLRGAEVWVHAKLFYLWPMEMIIKIGDRPNQSSISSGVQSKKGRREVGRGVGGFLAASSWCCWVWNLGRGLFFYATMPHVGFQPLCCVHRDFALCCIAAVQPTKHLSAESTRTIWLHRGRHRYPVEGNAPADTKYWLPEPQSVSFFYLGIPG